MKLNINQKIGSLNCCIGSLEYADCSINLVHVEL